MEYDRDDSFYTILNQMEFHLVQNDYMIQIIINVLKNNIFTITKLGDLFFHLENKYLHNVKGSVEGARKGTLQDTNLKIGLVKLRNCSYECFRFRLACTKKH